MNGFKLLTVVVPAYNSQDYLRHCLNTVVQGGPEVEVIIVDDGSTDSTAEIAQEYCRRFPQTVRLEQKENGGHGSAINRGLEMARGAYFKVVDSDDWLDIPELRKVLSALRADTPDLLIANYVYEYSCRRQQKVMRYRNVFPQARVISWEEMKRFRSDQLLHMHALYYRTALLRQCGIRLPEHTFYVDNLFTCVPLPFVKSLIYLDCSPYHYSIGRPDQSVNTRVMIRQIDEQLKVTRLMIEAYDDFRAIPYQNLRRYMILHLSMMVAASVLHIYLSEENSLGCKAEALWAFVRTKDKKLYSAIRHTPVNICIEIGRKTSCRLLSKGHKVIKHIYKYS